LTDLWHSILPYLVNIGLVGGIVGFFIWVMKEPRTHKKISTELSENEKENEDKYTVLETEEEIKSRILKIENELEEVRAKNEWEDIDVSELGDYEQPDLFLTSRDSSTESGGSIWNKIGIGFITILFVIIIYNLFPESGSTHQVEQSYSPLLSDTTIYKKSTVLVKVINPNYLMMVRDLLMIMVIFSYFLMIRSRGSTTVVILVGLVGGGYLLILYFSDISGVPITKAPFAFYENHPYPETYIGLYGIGGVLLSLVVGVWWLIKLKDTLDLYEQNLKSISIGDFLILLFVVVFVGFHWVY